ncbi:MAG: hypothetical protein K0R18_334 [Bacillales bacterium]|jgi:hypothetical protein|nr:hypothetical protein [Bacillales bacterium]
MFISMTILNIIYSIILGGFEMDGKDLFNNGWIHGVGVLCVLYVLFGGMSNVKVAAFIILILIAILEVEMTTQFFTKLFKINS